MTEQAYCSAWFSRYGERTKKCTSKAVAHDADDWINLCGHHEVQVRSKFTKEVRKRNNESMTSFVEKNIELRNEMLDLLMKAAGQFYPEKATGRRKPTVTGKPTYLYFIECQEYIKIGLSVDPAERLKTLRKSGNGTNAPRGIDLWEAQLMRAEPGTLEDEQAMHKKFAHLRVEGEWFKAEGDLLDYVDHLEKNTV